MITLKNISDLIKIIKKLLENNNLPFDTLNSLIVLKDRLIPARDIPKGIFLEYCRPFLNTMGNLDLKQDQYEDIVKLVQKIGDLSKTNYLSLLNRNLVYPQRDTLIHPIYMEEYNKIPYKEFFITGQSALHIPTMIDYYLVNNSVDNYRIRLMETPLSHGDLQRLETHMRAYLPHEFQRYSERKGILEESLKNYKPSRELVYAVATAAVSGLSLEGFDNSFQDGQLRQELPKIFYAQLNEIIKKLPEEERVLLERYPLQNLVDTGISTFGQVLKEINAGGCTSVNGPYLVKFVLDFVEPGFKFSNIRTNYESVTETLNSIQLQQNHFSKSNVKKAIKHSKDLIDAHIFSLRLSGELQLPYKGYKELKNSLLQEEIQKIDHYIEEKSSKVELSILYKFGHKKDWKISAAQALRVLFEKLDEGKNELSEEDFNQLKAYSLSFSQGRLKKLFFNCLNHFEGDFAEQIKNRVADIAGMAEIDKEFFRLQTQLRKKSENLSDQQKINIDELLNSTLIFFDSLKVGDGNEDEKEKLVSALGATDTYLFTENSDVNAYCNTIEEFNSSTYPRLKIVAGILLAILGICLLAAAVTLAVAIATPAAPLSALILTPVISLLSPLIKLATGLTIAHITLGTALAKTIVVSSTAAASGLFGGISTFFCRSFIKQGLNELKVKKSFNEIREQKEEKEFGIQAAQ